MRSSLEASKAASSARGPAGPIESTIDDSRAVRDEGSMVENNRAAMPATPPVMPAPTEASERTNANSDPKSNRNAGADEYTWRWRVIETGRRVMEHHKLSTDCRRVHTPRSELWAR